MASPGRGTRDRDVSLALFAECLAPRPRRLRLSFSLGFLTHASVIAAVALGSLLDLDHGARPQVAALLPLQLAPPPPPLLRRGAREADPAATNVEPRPAPTILPVIPAITEAMLTPDFDLALGAPDGFDDGVHPEGLSIGLAEGVMGGVPGGLVGGVIGGTGRELPRYPPPDVGPKPIRMPKAPYPETAVRENVSGSVKLLVVIDEQGRVEVLEVERSVPELDAAAIRTVESRWRFEPALRNGRPVPCVSHLVVRFHLR